MMSTKGRTKLASEDQMTQFRRVTDRLEVSPQITPDEARAAAAAGGADYLYLPVVGRPTPDQAKAQAAAVAAAKGPVLAFCRSGTRSITTWALGEAAAGHDKGELAKLGAGAGYDLSAALQG